MMMQKTIKSLAANRAISSGAPLAMVAQSRGFKVAVMGAAGGIGQPLGMLMKMNPLVTDLALYDIVGTPGVAADVGHMNSPAKVTGYVGDDQLADALKGADLVIIPAGVPRKPGMTRDDLFAINGGIVQGIMNGVAENCPKAFINMISNPVNSTVPIAAETMKKHGVYDAKRLFGVTTLDVVRAKTFYAEKKGQDVTKITVPVVGGHAGITILPLWSKVSPATDMSAEEIEALTVRTQNGGTEVVEAKAGKGSATLSMAYAGSVMADSCLRALNGEKNVTQCSYVESEAVPGCDFFSTEVAIGRNGIEAVHPVGDVSEYEAGILAEMQGQLKGEITKGQEFVRNQ